MSSLPSTLDECIAYWIDSLSNAQLESLRGLSEADFNDRFHHFTVGMSMRNGWKLWDELSPLHKWFAERGIYHADDMSGIIFTSLYRAMNSKPIGFSEQVKYYRDYWVENKIDPDTMEELK